MAFTVNGIGTAYYGQCDFWPDGSYITTEWFVLGYLPVFPIRSLRVLETGNATNAIVFSSEEYHVRPEDTLCVKQVLSIYLFTLVYGGAVIFAVWLYCERAFSLFWIALALIAPWVAVWAIRAYGRNAALSPSADGRRGVDSDGPSRARRCGKCDVPLTAEEAAAGKCSGCGARVRA